MDELKTQNWKFTYIEAEHDVEKMASKMSINNTMTFDKNSDGIISLFKKEQQSRINYSQKIRDKEDTSHAFYEDKIQAIDKAFEKKSSKNDEGFWKKLFGKD